MRRWSKAKIRINILPGSGGDGFEGRLFLVVALQGAQELVF
jgi:hypothetical protein